MRFWFDVLFLGFGLWLLGRGIASRSRKNPELYFGAGIVLSGIADFLPASATAFENALLALAALAMVSAAVLMFAFAEPAKSKSEPKDS